jgi:hypothetical protein
LYIKNYLNRSKRSLSEKERGYTEDKSWFNSCNGITQFIHIADFLMFCR